MWTKFEPKATGESDMWPTDIFAEFWCKCQNKLKIKVMLTMPISYDFSQSGYSWLPCTQSLKTAYYLQTSELFLCLSLIPIFWAINNIVMPLHWLLACCTIRASCPFLALLLSSFWDLSNWYTKWNWNSNLWQELVIDFGPN